MKTIAARRHGFGHKTVNVVWRNEHYVSLAGEMDRWTAFDPPGSMVRVWAVMVKMGIASRSILELLGERLQKAGHSGKGLKPSPWLGPEKYSVATVLLLDQPGAIDLMSQFWLFGKVLDDLFANLECFLVRTPRRGLNEWPFTKARNFGLEFFSRGSMLSILKAKHCFMLPDSWAVKKASDGSSSSALKTTPTSLNIPQYLCRRTHLRAPPIRSSTTGTRGQRRSPNGSNGDLIWQRSRSLWTPSQQPFKKPEVLHGLFDTH